MAVQVLSEGRYIGDWLKYEANSRYSRDSGTVPDGAGKLLSGTILGKRTSDSMLVPHTLGASDGSQTVYGILCFDTDATTGRGNQRVAIIRRHALVNHNALIYGADVTTANNRATVDAALATLAVLAREGA